MAAQHANTGHVVDVGIQGIVVEGPSSAGVDSVAAQSSEERSQPAGPSNRAWQPHCYEHVEGFVFSGKGNVPEEDEAGVVVLGPDGSLFVGLPPDAIAKQKRRAEEEQANAINLQSTYETANGAQEPVLPLTANDANQVPLAFQMLHRRRVRALMLLLIVDLAYAIASFAVDQSHDDPSPPPPPLWLSSPPPSARGFFNNNGPTFPDYAQLVSHVVVNVIGMAACDASARSMTVFLVLEVVITALSAVQKLTPILFIRIIIILIALQVRSGMIAMAAMRRNPNSQTASGLLTRLRELLGRSSPHDGPNSSQSLQQRVSMHSNNIAQNPAALQSHARLYTSHLLLHLFRHPPDQSRVHQDAIRNAL